MHMWVAAAPLKQKNVSRCRASAAKGAGRPRRCRAGEAQVPRRCDAARGSSALSLRGAGSGPSGWRAARRSGTGASSGQGAQARRDGRGRPALRVGGPAHAHARRGAPHPSACPRSAGDARVCQPRARDSHGPLPRAPASPGARLGAEPSVQTPQRATAPPAPGPARRAPAGPRSPRGARTGRRTCGAKGPSARKHGALLPLLCPRAFCSQLFRVALGGRPELTPLRDPPWQLTASPGARAPASARSSPSFPLQLSPSVALQTIFSDQ